MTIAFLMRACGYLIATKATGERRRKVGRPRENVIMLSQAFAVLSLSLDWRQEVQIKDC